MKSTIYLIPLLSMFLLMCNNNFHKDFEKGIHAEYNLNQQTFQKIPTTNTSFTINGTDDSNEYDRAFNQGSDEKTDDAIPANDISNIAIIQNDNSIYMFITFHDGNPDLAGSLTYNFIFGDPTKTSGNNTISDEHISSAGTNWSINPSLGNGVISALEINNGIEVSINKDKLPNSFHFSFNIYNNDNPDNIIDTIHTIQLTINEK